MKKHSVIKLKENKNNQLKALDVLRYIQTSSLVNLKKKTHKVNRLAVEGLSFTPTLFMKYMFFLCDLYFYE